MKKKAIALLVSLLMLLGMAQAQGTLTAELAEGGMQVCWSGCTGDATLTVYRDGWPILVESVGAGEGQYWVPGGYINRPGNYSVRLRANNCCLTATALGEVASDTQEPSPAPTQAPMQTTSPTPTQEPVQTTSPPPTQEPVQTASPEPTQEPVQTASPAPTQEPAQTSAPQQTPIPTRVPEPAPTPQPTQSEGNTLSALASAVIAQTNEERTSRGLNALTADAELNRAAAVRAREIVESFSHTRPDGSSWSTVSSSASGENIAKGHSTANRVMAAWMSSEGHRANILREGYTRIGVCAYEVGNVVYWVQLFGR